MYEDDFVSGIYVDALCIIITPRYGTVLIHVGMAPAHAAAATYVSPCLKDGSLRWLLFYNKCIL